MKYAVCGLAVLLAVGCGKAHGPMPILQKYDRLRAQLRAATMESRQIALETTTLGVAVAHGRVRRARRLSAALRPHALLFSRRSGHLGNRVRSLALQTESKTVKRYLEAVTSVLAWDWVEGGALQSVAEQVWRDPLCRTNHAQAVLRADAAWARTAASRAASSAASASQLRASSPASFRYRPLNSSS